jgi:hypothetical protein
MSNYTVAFTVKGRGPLYNLFYSDWHYSFRKQTENIIIIIIINLTNVTINMKIF